jgi:hypothetical protein
MKFPCAVVMLAALCTNARAEADADTLRKLTAVKLLAQSSLPISPAQVAEALNLTLTESCADVEIEGAGKFYICGYRPSVDDPQPLAFLYYKTVNRTAGQDTGGVVAFLTRGDKTCLRQKDLIGVFHMTPVASDAPAFPEPTLPYIPVSTYQFVFPKQGGSEVHVRVVQTGDCITTMELIKSSYHE